MLFRLSKLAALEVPPAHRIIAAGIQGIAAQRLAPVNRGRTGGVAILFQVQAGEVEFVGAGDLAGAGGSVAGGGTSLCA